MKRSVHVHLSAIVMLFILTACQGAPPPTPSTSLSTSSSVTPTQSETTASILGCYKNHNSEGTYSLLITAVSGINFVGRLRYHNIGFDSSSGTYTGTFQNELLFGLYSFNAEGSDSKRDVAFFKYQDGFVAAFAPTTLDGNYERILDKSKLESNMKYVYSPATNCN